MHNLVEPRRAESLRVGGEREGADRSRVTADIDRQPGTNVILGQESVLRRRDRLRQDNDREQPTAAPDHATPARL